MECDSSRDTDKRQACPDLPGDNTLGQLQEHAGALVPRKVCSPTVSFSLLVVTAPLEFAMLRCASCFVPQATHQVCSLLQPHACSRCNCQNRQMAKTSYHEFRIQGSWQFCRHSITVCAVSWLFVRLSLTPPTQSQHVLRHDLRHKLHFSVFTVSVFSWASNSKMLPVLGLR